MLAAPPETPLTQVKPFCQGVVVPPLSSSVSFLRLVITSWQEARGWSPCGGGRSAITVHTGPWKVAAKLVNATTSLVNELEKARLRIAPTKSKAACRSKPVRAELQYRLRESGVMCSKHGRSLRVDYAAGAMRRCAVANERLAMSGQRALRLRRLAGTRTDRRRIPIARMATTGLQSSMQFGSSDHLRRAPLWQPPRTSAWKASPTRWPC